MRHGFAGLIVALGLLLGVPARAQTAPLTVGIVPYLTPAVLIKLFQPLRTHLEKELGRPVELYTAPDVRSFVRRTLKPNFDLVITAAHFARIAQLDGGYVPIARLSGPLHAAIVVRQDSALTELRDLRGQRIAMTDRSILVNIAVLRLLADLGIGEEQLNLQPMNSQNSGILAVTRGDADATIIAHFTLEQIPATQRTGVRILFKSPPLPNITLLLRPDLDAGARQSIRQALTSFSATPDGQTFLQRNQFVDIQAVDDNFMKNLDVYLPETRRQLAP